MTDDPYTRIRTGVGSIDRAARACLNAGAPADQVEHLVREITRWSDAWAHVRVDKDREVRRAAAAALNCDQHGRTIAELERQLHSLEQQATATHRSRMAYLTGLHNIATALTALRQRIATGDDVPTLTTVVDLLAAAVAEIQSNADIHKPRRKPKTEQLDLFQDAA